MQQRITERLAGVTLMIGGLMGVLAHTIHPSAPQSALALHSYIQATVRAHLLLGAAVLLVCVGLPALCARLGRPGRLAGYVAYPLLFVGLISAEFLHCPVEIAIFPELEPLGYSQATRIVGDIFSGASVYGRVQSISLPLLVAGAIALLIAARGAETPRWPAVFLAGFLIFMAATFIPVVHNLPAGRLFAINLYLAFAAYGSVMIAAPLTSTQRGVHTRASRAQTSDAL